MQPESSEVTPVSPATEPQAKTTKRNSIFGSLFGKKDAASTPGEDTALAVPAKDPELTPVSVTAPQIKESSTTSNDPITPVPAPAPTVENSETSPINQTPAATGTPTEKRRSSFFNNLSTKREKKPEATSDADFPDAESKKYNTGKFGGLFRKPSRATPPVSKEASAIAPVSPLPEQSDTPRTEGEPTLTEQKTPVAASA